MWKDLEVQVGKPLRLRFPSCKVGFLIPALAPLSPACVLSPMHLPEGAGPGLAGIAGGQALGLQTLL